MYWIAENLEPFEVSQGAQDIVIMELADVAQGF